jgi:hypothetical protein
MHKLILVKFQYIYENDNSTEVLKNKTLFHY